MSATSNEDFAARLDRIRAGDGQHLLMVGQSEQISVPRKEFKQLSRPQEVARNTRYPASLLGAALLGMFGVGLGQYVHFQLLSGSDQLQGPSYELTFVAGFGILTAFVLSQAFRLKSKEHRALQGLGVFLMIGVFHNLSHWLPTPMGMVFSPAWVQTTVDTTPPGSFRLGQRYFPLLDQADPTAPEQTDEPKVAACAPNKPPLLVLDGKRRKTVTQRETDMPEPATADACATN
jgi:hypothetical protein